MGFAESLERSDAMTMTIATRRLVLCLALAGVAWAGEGRAPLRWQDMELPHAARSDEWVVISSPRRYTITMGGNVDMDHALTRDHGNWRVGWQPNESLAIENVGSEPVEDAKVIVNGRGNWYSIEEMLEEVLAGARSDQEKVYLIWQFCRENRHHDSPIYGSLWRSELHDPVKMLAVYGAGLCDDSGSIGASLYEAAGLTERVPFVRALHGHMMCEVFNEGRWQFMDIDQDVFYLDRENELPVGGDVVAQDHDLAHRDVHYGPIFHDWTRSRSAASLFGNDDEEEMRLDKGYRIGVRLRPGERIEYRWDNIGKWSSWEPGRGRRWVGNSRKIYEPRLDSERAGADEAKGVSLTRIDGRAAVCGDSEGASLTYRMSSDFVLCGGRVTASFVLRGTDDTAIIEAWSRDNKGQGRTEPVQVWRASGPGGREADVEIDGAMDLTHGGPEHEVFVRIRLVSLGNGDGAALTALAIRGDLMVSPLFLPRLRLGENEVVYTDDCPGERKVRLAYRWRETTAVTLPAAPALVYPDDGRTVRDEIVTYRWGAVAGARAYHFQVARDAAFRWPYRTGLDTIYEGTSYSVPFWGVYSPKTTYYWRVRAQSDKGLWGDWSEARTFRWAGPRVPVDVMLKKQGGRFVLSWAANARGARPVAYEVYGSDIKGFSVSKAPYEVPTLGEVGGNFVGRTTGTTMVVAGPGLPDEGSDWVQHAENLNRCFYRVVAVDEHGTHSGCSAYAEMPHPYIWSEPNVRAQSGKAYRYQPAVIRSLGDLQFRYEKPGKQMWEREQLSFSLVEGPAWLSVDSESGLLSGTAPRDGAGSSNVTLRVTASIEKRTGKDTYRPDTPPRHFDQTFRLVVSE